MEVATSGLLLFLPAGVAAQGLVRSRLDIPTKVAPSPVRRVPLPPLHRGSLLDFPDRAAAHNVLREVFDGVPCREGQASFLGMEANPSVLHRGGNHRWRYHWIRQVLRNCKSASISNQTYSQNPNWTPSIWREIERGQQPPSNGRRPRTSGALEKLLKLKLSFSLTFLL